MAPKCHAWFSSFPHTPQIFLYHSLFSSEIFTVRWLYENTSKRKITWSFPSRDDDTGGRHHGKEPVNHGFSRGANAEFGPRRSPVCLPSTSSAERVGGTPPAKGYLMSSVSIVVWFR